jgi:hypothetical protein
LGVEIFQNTLCFDGDGIGHAGHEPSSSSIRAS